MGVGGCGREGEEKRDSKCALGDKIKIANEPWENRESQQVGVWGQAPFIQLCTFGEVMTFH